MQVEIELRDGSRLVYTKAARAYYSRNVLIVTDENGKVVSWASEDAKIVGVFK